MRSFFFKDVYKLCIAVYAYTYTTSIALIQECPLRVKPNFFPIQALRHTEALELHQARYETSLLSHQMKH